MVMKGGMQYRGYLIYADGDDFVAVCPSDDEDPQEFIGDSTESLQSAIDEFWTILSGVTDIRSESVLPDWYLAWIEAGEQGRIRVPVASRPNRHLVPASEVTAMHYALAALADENGAIVDSAFRDVLEGFWAKHAALGVYSHYVYRGKNYALKLVPVQGNLRRFLVKEVIIDGTLLEPSTA